MRDYFHQQSPVRFVFPADGDCLNSRDGTLEEGRLWIEAQVAAPAGADITVNGAAARETSPGIWNVRLPLEEGRTGLTAADRAHPGTGDRITVFRLKGKEKGFRLSVDDNILFLEDLTRNQRRYHSLFENPYLALYRSVHEETGACVHLNLFYETGDLSAFSGERPYFNLSMMTSRFREEWRANADWLRLSFHSRTEHPGPPYSTPEEDKIAGDCQLVQWEIRRFAGDETLSEVTTVHFCACPIENVRALRELGVQGLAGFTGWGDQVRLSYHYPPEVAQRVAQRHFWVDTEEKIGCARIDSTLNTISPEDLPGQLEKAGQSGAQNGFLEFMIHEQYFYPDYCRYIPEFGDMVFSACRFARDRGYMGQSLSTLFAGLF